MTLTLTMKNSNSVQAFFICVHFTAVLVISEKRNNAKQFDLSYSLLLLFPRVIHYSNFDRYQYFSFAVGRIHFIILLRNP